MKDRVAIAMIDAAERDGLAASPAARSSSRRRATRRRARDRRRAARLPLHLRDERQDERREDRAAALVRRRGRRVPDRGAARGSALATTRPPNGSCARRRRVPPRPVLEPGQPARARTRRPARRSGGRPTAASRTSSPASAPAARSPASAAYLKAQNPDVQIIGADPSGSVYSGGTGRPYLVEGVGEDFWPTTFDPSLVDRVIEVSDADSFLTARRVTQRGRAAHRRLVRHRGARRARGRARRSARTTSSSCCCPTPAAATCRRSSTTSGCSTWASCAPTAPSSATCSRRRAATSPTSCSITPDEPARDAITLMRDTGVSQLVVSVTKELPLAAKEVVGTRARARADGPRSTATPACSTGRSARSAAPPMPMIGIGEPVARRRRVPRTATVGARRSTAATRSACSPAPTCSTFLAARAAP